MPGWLYVVLCLIVPLLWGALATRLFDWLQMRRRQSGRAPLVESEDMYYI